MKKRISSFPILFFLLVFTCTAFAGIKPPDEGELLPEIVLTVPNNLDHRKYLGLPGEGSFSIPQIKAEVVIIEIFSMYCPFCQKDAPIVNKLYNEIEQNGTLKDKIKLIGIGAGNSAFEVDFFRKTFNIAFPLFADADFSIHKILGQVRTPYFIGVKIKKDGTHSIFYSKLGSIKDSKKFMDLILRLSGL